MEVKIKKNESAPWDGILSNEEMYRRVDSQLRQCDITRVELLSCRKADEPEISFDWKGYTITFGIGVVAGIVLDSYLRRK
jgi:hypothetical protein